MRRYVYALAAATIMSAAMPVMAEETSTEEETSIEVDGTEEYILKLRKTFFKKRKECYR